MLGPCLVPSWAGKMYLDQTKQVQSQNQLLVGIFGIVLPGKEDARKRGRTTRKQTLPKRHPRRRKQFAFLRAASMSDHFNCHYRQVVLSVACRRRKLT